MEKLKSELVSLMEIINLRISSAIDSDDWDIIESQLKQASNLSYKIARKIRFND